jgi:uncharacterized protein YndB with AHSA1/START domain
MTSTTTGTLSVVVEREISASTEQVWHALTTSQTMEQWLMKNDFEPVVGHRFTLSADWGKVDCRVDAVEPNKWLSYSWAVYGLDSMVTRTLTPKGAGTHLRLEQSGFRPDQQRFYDGAKAGLPQFLAKLEQVVARNG